MIDCVVSFVGCHRRRNGMLHVSCTLSPWQKVVGPPAKINGLGGVGLITTVTYCEVSEMHAPFTITT